MNPMAVNYFEQINDALADLHEAIVEQREELSKERIKREELLQRFWSRQKEITTLNQGRDEYEQLKDENEALLSQQKKIKEKLGLVFEMCKTLREGLEE